MSADHSAESVAPCIECGCPFDWRASIGVASAERANLERESEVNRQLRLALLTVAMETEGREDDITLDHLHDVAVAALNEG